MMKTTVMLAFVIAVAGTVFGGAENVANNEKQSKKGLVALWDFGKSIDGKIINQSTAGIESENIAVIHGAKSLKDGNRKVLSFKGKEYIQIENGKLNVKTGGISIALWVKSSPLKKKEQSILISKVYWGYPGAGWMLKLTGDSLYAYAASGSDKKLVEIKSLLPKNKWVFIALVINMDDCVMNLFIDGELKASRDIDGYTGCSSPMRIGSLSKTGGYFFTGLIGKVAIYDKALSEDSIKSIMSTMELK